MNDPKFRLEEAPVLVLNAPDCGACDVEVESDGDSWICPNCGTCWSYDQGDGDAGDLYADWSGEDVSALPVVAADDAWKYAPGYSRLAEAVDAAKVEPNPAEPYGPQCADASEGFGIADIVAARDAARAAPFRHDGPFIVSAREAARLAGTPAESEIVVSVEIAPPAPVPAFPRDTRRPASPTSAFLSPRFTVPGLR